MSKKQARLPYGCLKESVSLHSQQKEGFREYFEYFLMRPKSFKKSVIRKVLRKLILHINNSKKLLKN